MKCTYKCLTALLFTGLLSFLIIGCSDSDKKTIKEAGLGEQLPKPEALVGVHLDWQTVVNLSKSAKKGKKGRAFPVPYSKIKSFDWLEVKDAYAFFYEENSGFEPVVVVNANADVLGRLTERMPFSQILEKSGTNRYLIKKTVKSGLPKKVKPFEDFEAEVRGDMLVVASKEWLAKGINPLEKACSKHFMAMSNGDFMVAAEINMPEKFDAEWLSKLTKISLVKSGKASSRFVNFATQLINDILEPLATLERIDVAFTMDQDKRKVRYWQTSRTQKEANEALNNYKNLDSDELAMSDVSEFAKVLVTNDLEKSVTSNGRIVKLDTTWHAVNDKKVKRMLFRPILRAIFAGPKPKATVGEITTEYSDNKTLPAAPLTVLSAKKIRTLSAQLKGSTFCDGNYGNSLRMTVENDAIRGWDGHYKVISAKDATGKELLSKDGKDNKELYFRVSDNTLEFRVELSGEAKELKPQTAKIQFDMEYPVASERLELSAKTGARVKGGFSVAKVKFCDGDALQLDIKPSRGSRIYVLDKTGKVLKKVRKNGMSMKGSGNWYGEVDKIVIDSSKMKKGTFELDFDLNGGQKTMLPKEASSDVITRLKQFPSSLYDSFPLEKLNTLTVSRLADKYNRPVFVNVPVGKFSYSAEWSAFCLKGDKIKFVSDSSYSRSGGGKQFQSRKLGAPDMRALIGQVKFTTKHDLKTYSFKKTSDMKEVSHVFDNGKTFTVNFNKNQIYFSDEVRFNKSKVLNKEGQDLKGETPFTHSKRWEKYWGTPTEFVFQKKGKEVSKTILFEFKGDASEAEWKAMKVKMAAKVKSDIREKGIVSVIKSILEKRKKANLFYGDDLAGYYYIYDKNGEPVSALSKELVQSDPKGAKKFGYQAKAYKGYYFTVLLGRIDENGKVTLEKPINRELTVKHKGGVLKYKKYWNSSLPQILATPVNKNEPTYIQVWDKVYKKVVKEEVKYCPTNIYGKKWEVAK